MTQSSKIDIFWLNSDEVLQYIKQIDAGQIQPKIINIRTQKYVVFDTAKQNVSIAWPSINDKIHHNIGQVEYFRTDPSLQAHLFKNSPEYMKKIVLFPCIVDLGTTHAAEYQILFPYYNPYIINYPMRIALTTIEGEDISQIINDFVADKIDYACVTIDDIAHIEYVPNHWGKLLESIPPHYWKLKNYELESGLADWQY